MMWRIYIEELPMLNFSREILEDKRKTNLNHAINALQIIKQKNVDTVRQIKSKIVNLKIDLLKVNV